MCIQTAVVSVRFMRPVPRNSHALADPVEIFRAFSAIESQLELHTHQTTLNTNPHIFCRHLTGTKVRMTAPTVSLPQHHLKVSNPNLCQALVYVLGLSTDYLPVCGMVDIDPGILCLMRCTRHC